MYICLQIQNILMELHNKFSEFFRRLFFRAQKSAVRLSGTSTFSLWASNFSCRRAQRASKCLKLNHSKSKQRLSQTLQASCPKGKLVIIDKYFFSPASKSSPSNLMTFAFSCYLFQLATLVYCLSS